MNEAESTAATPNPMKDLEAGMIRLQKAYEAVPLEERKRRQEAYEAKVRLQQADDIMKLLESGNAPKRHRSKSDFDPKSEWGMTLEKLTSRLGSGFLIALCGARGNGKTQLGVELMRKRAMDFKGSQFCSAMEFFMEIKQTYGKDGSSEKDIINRFCKHGLLVIDEIGRRSETDWENRLLYELLNRRYNLCFDTLLVSNQDKSTLEASLGDSLTSRMREGGGIVECNWPSFRA